MYIHVHVLCVIGKLIILMSCLRWDSNPRHSFHKMSALPLSCIKAAQHNTYMHACIYMQDGVHAWEISWPVGGPVSVLQCPGEVAGIPEPHVTISVPCNVVSAEVNGLIPVLILQIVKRVCRHEYTLHVYMYMYMYMYIQYMYNVHACTYMIVHVHTCILCWCTCTCRFMYNIHVHVHVCIWLSRWRAGVGERSHVTIITCTCSRGRDWGQSYKRFTCIYMSYMYNTCRTCIIHVVHV